MLADLILVLHAAFVFFVVVGLVAIWVGFAMGRASASPGSCSSAAATCSTIIC